MSDSKLPVFLFLVLPVWSVEIRRMEYFNLIRYYDPITEKKKEMKILEDLSAYWVVVGDILGFSPSEIEAIRNAGAGKTPVQCIRDVFTKWMKNADGMPNSKRFPSNWAGVYNLLKDSQQSTLAKDLKDAIEAYYSDLNQNFDKSKYSLQLFDDHIVL